MQCPGDSKSLGQFPGTVRKIHVLARRCPPLVHGRNTPKWFHGAQKYAPTDPFPLRHHIHQPVYSIGQVYVRCPGLAEQVAPAAFRLEQPGFPVKNTPSMERRIVLRIGLRFHDAAGEFGTVVQHAYKMLADQATRHLKRGSIVKIFRQYVHS